MHPFKSDRGGFCIDCRPTRVGEVAHAMLAEQGIEDVNDGPIPGEILASLGREPTTHEIAAGLNDEQLASLLKVMNAQAIVENMTEFRARLDAMENKLRALENNIATNAQLIQKQTQFIGDVMNERNGTGPTVLGVQVEDVQGVILKNDVEPQVKPEPIDPSKMVSLAEAMAKRAEQEKT
jgi:hypothetical protein